MQKLNVRVHQATLTDHTSVCSATENFVNKRMHYRIAHKTV